MSIPAGLQHHEGYNNRFRTSSIGSEPNSRPTEIHLSGRLESLDENVDVFGHASNFGQLSFSNFGDRRQSQTFGQTDNMVELPRIASISDGRRLSQEAQSPTPLIPGLPRRLSRQMSAETARHLYANMKSTSSEFAKNNISTDSAFDEVFVETVDGRYQRTHAPAIFSGKTVVQPKISVTSTTCSLLPNPYNKINHKIHSIIWCCNCLYFVFFCCLPAIHFMEHSDIEYERGNDTKARRHGLVSSLLFFTGTILMLSMFALVFFLAIYFSFH